MTATLPETTAPATVRPPRIALVGGTGAVGRTFLDLIAQRGFAFESIRLVASPRSAGRTLPVPGGSAVVESLESCDFDGVDLAFFSAGTPLSVAHAPRAATAGALVVDNTNAFRMDPASPLVVPQVNGGLLARRPESGIVANPNCSTIPLARLLKPIQERYGLDRVTVSTYQAASGGGQSGIDELRADTAARLADFAAPAPENSRFGPGLAFNVVPAIDRLLAHGGTLEEQKMRQESRRILGLDTLDLTATCVRVPVVNGHSEAVVIDAQDEVDARELTDLLDAQEEVRVWREGWPTPRTAAAESDLVHVGRVRTDPENPRRVLLWLVADNLRIGAALNALQIAEKAVAHGIVGGSR
ncbi:aspartate-semialdehyde dehydrogenase [Streptomyces sp. NPDC091272]|uniref:aspartate-semialdehyde dehydrogenase n=1 Tax=Streptomyces sp. NPDC091272 TaxID=3365981 RepID=UPI003810D3E0